MLNNYALIREKILYLHAKVTLILDNTNFDFNILSRLSVINNNIE